MSTSTKTFKVVIQELEKARPSMMDPGWEPDADIVLAEMVDGKAVVPCAECGEPVPIGREWLAWPMCDVCLPPPEAPNKP